MPTMQESTIHSALPDTRRSNSPKEGWEGVVHVHWTQSGREFRRDVPVCHCDDGTTDTFGNSGKIKTFASDGDALNAALRMSKLIMSGEREF